MISSAMVKQAISSGLCPLCGSPMIPGKGGETSSCSDSPACGLGVLPPCETYAPAKRKFSEKKRSDFLAKLTRFEKSKKTKLYSSQGKLWQKVRQIGLTKANKMMSRKYTENPLFPEFSERKEEPRLNSNQIIGAHGKGIAIFERID